MPEFVRLLLGPGRKYLKHTYDTLVGFLLHCALHTKAIHRRFSFLLCRTSTFNNAHSHYSFSERKNPSDFSLWLRELSKSDRHVGERLSDQTRSLMRRKIFERKSHTHTRAARQMNFSPFTLNTAAATLKARVATRNDRASIKQLLETGREERNQKHFVRRGRGMDK